MEGKPISSLSLSFSSSTHQSSVKSFVEMSPRRRERRSLWTRIMMAFPRLLLSSHMLTPEVIELSCLFIFHVSPFSPRISFPISLSYLYFYYQKIR